MNRYTATVQGWGKDYLERQGVYLTQVDLTIRKKSICNKEYERVRDSVKNHLMPNLSIDAMFCTDGNLREDAGTCYGDSGGPMVTTTGDGVTPGQNYQLIGNVIKYRRFRNGMKTTFIFNFKVLSAGQSDVLRVATHQFWPGNLR